MKNFFLKTAYLLGQESKCVSRQVGAVIADHKRIISTGINGTPAGHINCNEVFNIKKFDREEHHKWSKMNEIHAEMNAIIFAAAEGKAIEGSEMYTILQPCDECLKNIIGAKIKKIYYVIPYDKATKDNPLWKLIEHEQVDDPELLQWIFEQDEWNKRKQLFK